MATRLARSTVSRRVISLAERLEADRAALLTVAGVVLLANALYLLGIFDPNPLGGQAAVLLAHSPGALGGSPVIDPNIGFTSQALGHRAALDLLSLHLPWWNPYEATGVPLAGEMQAAALFPPTLLLAFANGQIYEHVLLEILAGCSTFLLLRRLAIGREASVAGAIAFELNGTFAWFGHAAVNPIAFAPMLLLGIEIAYGRARGQRAGGWWLIAIAGALSVYAGFPETAYVDTLLAVGWVAWRCRCAGRQYAWAFLRKVIAASLTGLALAAPILTAFVRYLQSGYSGSHAGTENLHLPLQALPQLLLPYVWGPIFGFHDAAGTLPHIWSAVGGYLTVSLVMFAMLGVTSRRYRGLRVMLGAWIGLALSRMYGIPLLGAVLGLVPGMSSVQFFRLADPSVAMAMCVLAALGLDSLREDPERRRRVVRCALATVGLVAVATIGAAGLANRLLDGGPGAYFALAVLAGVAVVAAGTAAALSRDPALRTRAACGVVIAEVVVMFVVPQLSAPRSERIGLGAVSYLRAHLGQQRFFTLGPVQPNYGSYFGAASLNNNDLPLPSNWVRYLQSSLDPNVNVFHFVGNANGGRSKEAPSTTDALIDHLTGYEQAAVAYVVTEPFDVLPEPLTIVLRTTDAWVYRLPGAQPFFTAPHCEVTAGGEAAVDLSCSTPTILVRRETYMPGWSAAIDGQPAALHEVEHLFQAVRVPAGRHRVTFSFAPPGIDLAYLAFLLGCAALAGGVVRARRRNARPPIIAAAAPPAPEIVGRIERVDGGAVLGWAWCPERPAARVLVRTVLDGEPAGSTVADLPRPSLQAAQIGDGSHGFRVRLPARRASAGPHSLRVEVDGGAPLPSSAGFSGAVQDQSDPWCGALFSIDSSGDRRESWPEV